MPGVALEGSREGLAAEAAPARTAAPSVSDEHLQPAWAIKREDHTRVRA